MYGVYRWRGQHVLFDTVLFYKSNTSMSYKTTRMGIGWAGRMYSV